MEVSTKILRYIKVQAKAELIRLVAQPWFKNSNKNDGIIYAVITIDTEQDFSKGYTNTGTYHNIKVGIPKLLGIFDNYNCKASWMVTPDVAISYPDILKELSNEKHEIGCHVHPEYFTEPSIAHIRHKAYLCNMPMDAQRDMIRRATDIIEKSVEKRPRSFRAGRYGINNRTLDALKSEGYLVDTSISPNMNWSRDGGPDWSKFNSTKPYFRDTLLEVPITIIKVMELNYLFRPSVSTVSTMKTIVKILGSQQKGPIVLNMMFHSMESVDPNPYLKSEVLLKRLKGILEYLCSKNTEFVTLHQLYEIIREKQ